MTACRLLVTDVHCETVGRLAPDVGEGCKDIHDVLMRGLSSGAHQLDEVFALTGRKARGVA